MEEEEEELVSFHSQSPLCGPPPHSLPSWTGWRSQDYPPCWNSAPGDGRPLVGQRRLRLWRQCGCEVFSLVGRWGRLWGQGRRAWQWWWSGSEERENRVLLATLQSNHTQRLSIELVLLYTFPLHFSATLSMHLLIFSRVLPLAISTATSFLSLVTPSNN